MTDKQVIIDDVDVSGCECYNQNIKMDCLLYPLQPDACKNNPNCYYKQLARKEQECKELKQTLAEIEEIAMGIMDDDLEESSAYYDAKQILQKISKVIPNEN